MSMSRGKEGRVAENYRTRQRAMRKEMGIQLYKEGWSTYEIAEVLGVTRPAVGYWINEAVLEVRGKVAGDHKERFWKYVDKKKGDCWEWTGVLTTSGYGKFEIDGKTLVASRVVYEWECGIIPEGMFVCHTCDNPKCVRPEHLWVGTAKDNNLDCINKGRHRSKNFHNFVGGACVGSEV